MNEKYSVLLWSDAASDVPRFVDLSAPAVDFTHGSGLIYASGRVALWNMSPAMLNFFRGSPHMLKGCFHLSPSLAIFHPPAIPRFLEGMKRSPIEERIPHALVRDSNCRSHSIRQNVDLIKRLLNLLTPPTTPGGGTPPPPSSKTSLYISQFAC